MRASGNSSLDLAPARSRGRRCRSSRLNAETRRYSSSRSGVGGDLDEADRLEPGRQAGLGLEPRVQVAGVLAHLGRRLRRRAEGDHQPGRVPRRARGEPVALEQHDVLPAQVGEVVGDRGADDAAADDHDPRSGGQVGRHRRGEAHRWAPIMVMAATAKPDHGNLPRPRTAPNQPLDLGKPTEVGATADPPEWASRAPAAEASGPHRDARRHQRHG